MHTDLARSRRLALAAAATGATFVVEALVELLHKQAQPFTSLADYALEALFALGLALAAVTWWGLRSSGAVDGRRGRIGAAIAASGNAALALSATVTAINGADALGPVFMLGLLAALVGPLTVATSAGSRALGSALTIGLIASMAVGTGGAAILGLAWIAVSTLLRSPLTAASPSSTKANRGVESQRLPMYAATPSGSSGRANR